MDPHGKCLPGSSKNPHFLRHSMAITNSFLSSLSEAWRELQHQRQEYVAFYVGFMSRGAGVISVRSICGYISFFPRDISPFSMLYRRGDIWLVHTLSTSPSSSWPVSCTLMPLPYLRIGSNVPKANFSPSLARLDPMPYRAMTRTTKATSIASIM